MKTKKFLWGLLFIISMAILTAGIMWMFMHFLGESTDNSVYIDNNENSESVDMNVAENHNIKWNKLKNTNTDIYSWIYIPHTSVDYAVVQADNGEDDDFYLNHNLKKDYEFAGSIYSEMQNSKNYTDPVTVLYGHNMLNGTMFATLHKFEDPNFFKKNKFIYIYKKNQRLTFKIYAAYVYDDRHILNSFDFSDPEILADYQKYTLNPDSMTKNTRKVKLDANSKILTLSTCTNGAENTRYIVQGVLVKNEQTK